MNCYDIITKEIITYTLITTHNNDHMPKKQVRMAHTVFTSFYLFFDPLVDFNVKFHSANGWSNEEQM